MDPFVFSFVKYLHVLLFVYWLGGDLGVWMTGKQMIRDDLSLDERLRIRQVGALIDMAPRVCLVLMIPVGFTLASNWGSQLNGPVLLLLWVFCMAWLWLVWEVHWKKNEPIGKTLGSIDLKLRYVIGTAILGYGLYNLVGGGPVTEIVLRKIAGNWQTAFDMIRAGGEQRVAGELQMKANRRRVEPPVLTIWALVAIMGFLGVTKPF
jgi:hypothetical protein